MNSWQQPYSGEQFFGTTGGEFHLAGQLAIDGASRVRATRGTAQSIPNATETVVLYNTETEDNLSEYDATTGKFTAIKSGTYKVTAAVFYSTASWTSAEFIVLSIFKNGGVYSRLGYERFGASITNAYFLNGSDEIELAAGDYIEIKTFHNQGAAVSLLNSATYNFLSIHRLS